MSNQRANNIHIRVLHEVVPDSMLEDISPSVIPFPGPLFGDPSTMSIGIMSSGTTAQIKTKKSQLLVYMQEKEDQLEKGVGHLSIGSPERRSSEDRLTLLHILRVLVENDGVFGPK